MDAQKNYNFWESVAKAVNVEGILLTKQNNELILLCTHLCLYFRAVFYSNVLQVNRVIAVR